MDTFWGASIRATLRCLAGFIPTPAAGGFPTHDLVSDFHQAAKTCSDMGKKRAA